MDKTIFLIQEMLEYNKWANEKLLKCLEAMADHDYRKEIAIPFLTIHSLLNHLYYYDTKNLQRIIHHIAEPIVKKELQRAELAELLQANSLEWLNWIKMQKELSIETVNNLMLLSTHNIHHRGQLTVGINLLGYEMPGLDAYKFRDHHLSSRA